MLEPDCGDAPLGGLLMNRTGTIVQLALLLLMAFLSSGPVPYTAPSGDLNLDGKVDAQDLQCEIVIYTLVTAAGTIKADKCATDEDCLAQIGAKGHCRPGLSKHLLCLHSCLHDDVPVGKDEGIVCIDPEADNEYCLGTVHRRSADMNCDGSLGTEDFIFLVAVIMESPGGTNTPDIDADGQLNYCDPDMDGDGDPNDTDCDPLDPLVSANGLESCNGIDDDCDNDIDEDLPPVTCGVSICEHSEPSCIDGVPVECDPYLGAELEECNGLDDNCSGKIDDGADPDLCSDHLATPHLKSVVCLSGKCVASQCDPGWHDLNSDASDGCECTDDKIEKSNKGCSFSKDLGDLSDAGAGSIVDISGNEPEGNGDWFRFFALDVAENNTDSFHVHVKFLDNPDDSYAFDMYWGGCADNEQICAAATVADWHTDFSNPGAKQACPPIPGPGVAGGGESNCRPDANHSVTPGNFGDDTDGNSHQCKDNSQQFLLRVYIAPGKKPTCASYKLEISNGVY